MPTFVCLREPAGATVADLSVFDEIPEAAKADLEVREDGHVRGIRPGGGMGSESSGADDGIPVLGVPGVPNPGGLWDRQDRREASPDASLGLRNPGWSNTGGADAGSHLPESALLLPVAPRASDPGSEYPESMVSPSIPDSLPTRAPVRLRAERRPGTLQDVQEPEAQVEGWAARIGEIARYAAEHRGEDLAIDTETDGLDAWRGNIIRGVSLCIADRSWYLPLTHLRSDNAPRGLVRHLLLQISLGRSLTWANGLFDWSMLEADLQLPAKDAPNQWDVLLGGWLEDENIQAKGLKDRHEFVFGRGGADEQKAMRALCAGPTLAELEDEHYYGPEGKEGATAKGRRPNGLSRAEARDAALADPRYGAREMWDLTADEMAPYARRDAELTRDLRRYQQSLDHRHPIGTAMPREMDVARVIFGMQRLGVRIDAHRAERAHAGAVARLAQLEGLFEGVNLNSPSQLAALVYGDWGFPCFLKTATGAQSTSRDALELLGDDGRINALMECRRLGKAISAYYRPLLNFIDSNNRIHPSIKQHGTRTGRFSAERPNVYTIPREDTLNEVRQVFVPEPGYELWEYDLSQAELRAAAAISGEPWMIAAFAEGRDVYQEVADGLWCTAAGCRRDNRGRCGHHRQRAKTVVLAYQYGQKEHGLAVSLLKGTGRAVTPRDVNEAAAIQRRFADISPRLVRVKDHLARVAREDGRLPLPPPGRYRHFRGAGHPPEEYSKALNCACQGGIGELQKSSIVAAQPELRRLGVRLLLNIYDSYLCEVPPGLSGQVAAMWQEVTDDLNFWPSVRQVVEAKEWA